MGILAVIGIGILVYQFIKEASEPTLPADYHNNWRLEAEDSQKVREGKMTQRQFEKNKEVGLTYNISCHSFRKFFGNQSYKLHPHDADRIKMIQFLFGHSSEEITKLYIATIDEKKEQYMDDFSEYMKSMFEGKNYEIDNSPVITIKNADLRLIVYEIYMRGKTATADTNDIEQINELITKIEQMRVQ